MRAVKAKRLRREANKLGVILPERNRNYMNSRDKPAGVGMCYFIREGWGNERTVRGVYRHFKAGWPFEKIQETHLMGKKPVSI